MPKSRRSSRSPVRAGLQHPPGAGSGPPGQVRIIAGSLRGSRIAVPDRPGLRPTSDRVRETLFNWLQPILPGSRVLDLFAGVGALGFEAMSRGAAAATLVERDRQTAHALEDTARRLGVDRLRVIQADALTWLDTASEDRFDLVFLDPPFGDDLLPLAIAALPKHLAETAMVYVESPAETATGHALAVPVGWRLWREGRTRQVRYALYRAGD